MISLERPEVPAGVRLHLVTAGAGGFVLVRLGDSWAAVTRSAHAGPWHVCVLAPQKQEALYWGEIVTGDYLSPLLPAREWLAVPFGEREAAKAKGAYFDPAVSGWYVPRTAQGDSFERWRSSSDRARWRLLTTLQAADPAGGDRYLSLSVPYREREWAKRLGARWARGRWMVWLGLELFAFRRWMDDPSLWLRGPTAAVFTRPRWLRVPPGEEENLAKAAGAIKSRKNGVWYAPTGAMRSQFLRWSKVWAYESPEELPGGGGNLLD